MKIDKIIVIFSLLQHIDRRNIRSLSMPRINTEENFFLIHIFSHQHGKYRFILSIEKNLFFSLLENTLSLVFIVSIVQVIHSKFLYGHLVIWLPMKRHLIKEYRPLKQLEMCP